MPRFSTSEQGTARSTWICEAQDRALSLERGEISQPHHGSTHSAPSKPSRQCPVFFHPAGSLVPSPVIPSPDPRGRRATPARQTELPPPCAHAEGTRRCQAEHTPPTRPPRGHGILLCPMPASGRWHPKCRSSRSRRLLAITAQPLYRQNPEGKWPGRAGSSGGRRWKCWPKPGFDLLAVSRARSPPSLRGQLGSFLTTSTLEQPSVCVAMPRGCPEQGEIQVLFSSWNCLGKAEPRSIATAPQKVPPANPCTLYTEKRFQRTNKRCFSHRNELRSSRSAQVQLWSPKSNSSAEAKGSRAGAGAQNSCHKGELSNHRERKAVSSPPAWVCRVLL